MRRNTRSMVERVAYLQWVGIPTDQWATVIRKCPRYERIIGLVWVCIGRVCVHWGCVCECYGSLVCVNVMGSLVCAAVTLR